MRHRKIALGLEIANEQQQGAVGDVLVEGVGGCRVISILTFCLQRHLIYIQHFYTQNIRANIVWWKKLWLAIMRILFHKSMK